MVASSNQRTHGGSSVSPGGAWLMKMITTSTLSHYDNCALTGMLWMVGQNCRHPRLTTVRNDDITEKGIDLATKVQAILTSAIRPERCDNASSKRSEYCMQITTADAAVSSANAAWAGAGVGTLTLLAAIAAAIFARRAAEYSLEIGHAQVRCYLASKDASFRLDATGQPGMTIKVTNSGQSPARKFRWNFEVDVAKAVSDGWRWSHKSMGLVPTRDIPANTCEIFSLTKCDGNVLNQGDLSDLLLNAQIRIKAKVTAKWLDVFGREYHETWPFEALLPGMIDSDMNLFPEIPGA